MKIHFFTLCFARLSYVKNALHWLVETQWKSRKSQFQYALFDEILLLKKANLLRKKSHHKNNKLTWLTGWITIIIIINQYSFNFYCVYTDREIYRLLFVCFQTNTILLLFLFLLLHFIPLDLCDFSIQYNTIQFQEK